MKHKVTFLFVLSLSFYFCGCTTSLNLGIQTYKVSNENGDTLTFYLGSKEEQLSNKLLYRLVIKEFIQQKKAVLLK